MNSEPRTERRFGVTAKLTPNAVARLYSLRLSETWQDLLDVMEQVCIETETELINTDAEQEQKVLANHKMSKAAWQVFMHMQRKVDECLNTYLAGVATQPEGVIFSDEERERENILNPTVDLQTQ
jgi:L-lactate utilization protein LutC